MNKSQMINHLLNCKNNCNRSCFVKNSNVIFDVLSHAGVRGSFINNITLFNILPLQPYVVRVLRSLENVTPKQQRTVLLINVDSLCTFSRVRGISIYFYIARLEIVTISCTLLRPIVISNFFKLRTNVAILNNVLSIAEILNRSTAVTHKDAMRWYLVCRQKRDTVPTGCVRLLLLTLFVVKLFIDTGVL